MNQLTTEKTLLPHNDVTNPADYETDFVLWIGKQLELLRAKRFEQLDLDNIIEELDGMNKSVRHALGSRLETVLVHLLKCQFQPERVSGSWRGSLREQRSRIARIIDDSPSLAQYVMPYAARSYKAAVDRAADETGLQRSTFPAENPYTQDQLLDPEFIP
jgi:hypothetical protein